MAKKMNPIIMILLVVVVIAVVGNSVDLFSFSQSEYSEVINEVSEFTTSLFSVFPNSDTTFSIVGNTRRCDTTLTPGNEIRFPSAEHPDSRIAPTTEGLSNQYCGSGNALYNVFDKDSQYDPELEWRSEDNVAYTCSVGDVCRLQIYCCDYPECDSDSNCIGQVGTGSTCETAQCTQWPGTSAPTKRYKCSTPQATEELIPYHETSFNYCTSAGTGVNCWYRVDTTCFQTWYTQTTCPATLAGRILYPSESLCLGSAEDNTCMEIYADKNPILGNVLIGDTCSVNAECKSGYCHDISFALDRCDVQNGANNYLDTLATPKDISSSPLFVDYYWGTISLGVTRLPGNQEIGQFCGINAECKSGYCNYNGFWSAASCDSSLSTPADCSIVINPTGPSSTDFISSKKISLSEEEIFTSTSKDLLSSACLGNSECVVTKEDEGSFVGNCIPIEKLRERGIITNTVIGDFFSNAKSITIGTTVGATVGVSACVILSATTAALSVGPAVVLGSPAILSGCAAVGALFGGVGTSTFIFATATDDLLSELQAENANEVGICTKELSGGFLKFFEWAAFFDVTGDGIKGGIDGLIIVGTALFTLILIFRGGGRR